MTIQLNILGIEHIIFEAIMSIRSAGCDIVTEKMIFNVINREDVKKVTQKSYKPDEVNNTISEMINNNLLEELTIPNNGKNINIIIFTIKGNNYLKDLRSRINTIILSVKAEEMVCH